MPGKCSKKFLPSPLGWKIANDLSNENKWSSSHASEFWWFPGVCLSPFARNQLQSSALLCDLPSFCLVWGFSSRLLPVVMRFLCVGETFILAHLRAAHCYIAIPSSVRQKEKKRDRSHFSSLHFCSVRLLYCALPSKTFPQQHRISLTTLGAGRLLITPLALGGAKVRLWGGR